MKQDQNYVFSAPKELKERVAGTSSAAEYVRAMALRLVISLMTYAIANNWYKIVEQNMNWYRVRGM